MLRWSLVIAAIGCSPGYPPGFGQDAPPPQGDAAGMPAPIAPGDFTHALDKAYIRAPQTWIGDAAFDVKFAAMLQTPIAFLGGADSAYHADLASRPVALPGGEVICHGDPKLDNFGWVRATASVSNVDFDDGGACPAAADILHFLLGADLAFGNTALDDLSLDTYVNTVASDASAIAIDPTTQPVWDDLRKTGVDKATKNGKLTLGGEIEAASSDEVDAVTALVASDPRFPTVLVDVARDVKTDGGSAGLRRFWLLIEDAQHPRTIIELKELATPGTEFGPHTTTYDGDDRFDILVPFWWSAESPDDHFGVSLLGTRWIARDRFAHHALDASELTAAQVQNGLAAEASLMAQRHRAAWAAIDPEALRAWLRPSMQAIVARWRGAYQADGGT